MLLERQAILKFLIAVILISAAAAQPAFDVASIRASQSGQGEGDWRDDIQATPGSLIMRNVSLKTAIRWAYHVLEYQVSGPQWVGADRYNITAKAGGPATEDQLRLMLQSLLAERFKLTFHRQTKEIQAYMLTVAKGGAKFRESEVDGAPVITPDKTRMTMDVKGIPASLVVDMLAKVLSSPVVNNTGFTGRYDITMNFAKYMPDGTTPFDPVATTILAVQEELGLKLEYRRVIVDLLIIDGAEKVPVEN